MTPVVLVACAALISFVLLAAVSFWTLDRVLVTFADERASWLRQQDWLLQRLQAPATAVAQYIPPSDDDDVDTPEQPVYHDEQDEINAQVRGI